MPVNFNSFSSNPGSNTSRPLQLSNFDFNMNQGRRGFDVQLLVNNSNNRQNNELITYQRGMTGSLIGLGQLSLRQRLGDVVRRNNYPSPNRVQVQNFIDCVPVERLPGISEVTVTEVVKTKFLTSNSTRDRLLAPNDHFISAAIQEPNFPRGSLLMSNQPFQPYAEGDGSLGDAIFQPSRIKNQFYNLPITNMFTMNDPLAARNEQPFHNMYQRNFSQNQASSPRMGTTVFTQVNSPFTATDQTFQNVCNQNPTQYQPNPCFINLGDPSLVAKNDETPDPRPVNVPVEHQDENQLDDQLEKPVHELLEEYYRNLVGYHSSPLKKSPRSNVRGSYFVETSVKDEDETEARNDGRTHSLSREKYGPYTCPKCKEVFLTSQLFAAHVSASHYRFETFAERKKRLSAKYKKKNLRLVHLRDGITIASDQSFREIIRRRKVKRAGKTNSDHRVQREKGKNIVAGAASERFSHVDVDIKKEYE